MSCRKSRPTQEGLGSKIPEMEAHAQGEAWMSEVGEGGGALKARSGQLHFRLATVTLGHRTSPWDTRG